MREKYKNILVAVDGSEQSDKAVREAVKIARDFYNTNITENFPKAAPYVTNYAYLIHVESLLQIYEWKMSEEEFTAQAFISKVNEITTPVGLSSEA
ncbi:MAG: universal stress protein, partial [Lactococcus garvieae]